MSGTPAWELLEVRHFKILSGRTSPGFAILGLPYCRRAVGHQAGKVMEARIGEESLGVLAMLLKKSTLQFACLAKKDIRIATPKMR